VSHTGQTPPRPKGIRKVSLIANQDLSGGGSLGRRNNMLWTIIAVLVILWLLGFSMHVGGGLIHALLVIAVIVFVLNLLTGRRSSV
jgi:hypothetical protein